MTPIPLPDGWPSLPERPRGLDGPVDDQRVALADRPYDRTTCPSCEAALDPLPKAKKRCPNCGQSILVRSGPDDRRYLIREDQLEELQARWTAASFERWAAAEASRSAALEEWRRQLAAAGFAVGPRDLDVVGESFYHQALAGIRAALHEESPGYEVRAPAVMRRDPGNQYDRDAIAVLIHGQQVGHLDRADAAEYQRLLKGNGGELSVQAVLMGGRPTALGEVGPIGVVLDDVPEPT